MAAAWSVPDPVPWVAHYPGSQLMSGGRGGEGGWEPGQGGGGGDPPRPQTEQQQPHTTLHTGGTPARVLIKCSALNCNNTRT